MMRYLAQVPAEKLLAHAVRAARRLCAALLLGLAAFGLVQAQTGAQSAPASTQQDAAGPHALSPPPQDESSQYIIGPGDKLQVFVWRNPDLSQTVPVRPDGRISTPLVQNMVAVGKTPAQLARDMEQVLGQYLRSPQVNIIVTDPVGQFSEVKVVGQVQHPEAVPYHEGMTVLDVVLKAGGLTQYAAGNRAKLVRIQQGKTQQLPVRLKSLMEQGDLSQNLPVKPGDVLVVPEARF